ncbi:hypothetical protein CSB37_02965 [bacterium DOLZORAL124_38_8]|nr:MAG: hypothetical protein CSB37_02965 [bacterium DOLZORAL124_38_8]
MTSKKLALGFGLDFIKFCIPAGKEEPILDSLFWGLSDNSPTSVGNFFGFPFDLLYKENGNKDLLFLNINGDPLICIEKVKDTGIVRNYSYFIIFYGLYFCIPQAQNVIKKFVERFHYAKITRVDLALDLPMSPTQFLKAGYETKFRITSEFGKNEQNDTIETKYFGQKNSSNKRHFIRIYDKLKDTKKKHKMLYYLDYMEHDDVCRCEVQVNSLSCKSYRVTTDKILHKDFQKNLFLSLCKNSDGTYFKALDFYEFDSAMRIRPDRLSTNDTVRVLDKLKYARTMMSYVRTLHENNFDVLGYIKGELYPVD